MLERRNGRQWFMLADFFSVGQAGESSPAGGARFAAVEQTSAGGPAREACQETLARLPPGGALAVAIRLDTGGRLRRLGRLLMLPLRMALAGRSLTRCGAASVQRYGVFPDLRTPAVVFPLGTPAARYAEEHLVPGPRQWFLAVIRKVLTRCLGYDPSLGAVLVVGRKP
jgi:hypothetical protein